MSLPGLDQLESTPEILRLLMTSLSEEDANWKPAPNRFSIAEALEHLSHTEGHCFRARVEAMVEQDNPPIEPYDPEVYFAAGQYSGRSAEDSFDHFEEQRELNLEYWALKIACPFLENESCSIYKDRPIACREYLVVTDPKHCAEARPENVKGAMIMDYDSLPDAVSFPLFMCLRQLSQTLRSDAEFRNWFEDS